LCKKNKLNGQKIENEDERSTRNERCMVEISGLKGYNYLGANVEFSSNGKLCWDVYSFVLDWILIDPLITSCLIWIRVRVYCVLCLWLSHGFVVLYQFFV
jgi:hypothetical protein